VGVLTESSYNASRGFSPYLKYLTTVKVKKLWVNRLMMDLPKGIFLSGAAVDPVAIQEFQGSLTKLGSPFSGKGLRVAEFTGLLKLSTKEKKILQNERRKARKAEVQEKLLGKISKTKNQVNLSKVSLEKSYRFIITEWPKTKLEDYQTILRGDKVKKRKKIKKKKMRT
jgi:hypothetical protein